ncbi:hypothetical protein SKAU_G00153830 [Synaphobranchus kaupii]|uniref:Uncharacterized protein n=1 Tax=Synaphobranchus kaupii TaxID=118154 RepID=A0A9Q1FHC1_SYNKA|nr:hypothetical protein SKAU_G00153830 [Synaphobranchus kaupii]
MLPMGLLGYCRRTEFQQLGARPNLALSRRVTLWNPGSLALRSPQATFRTAAVNALVFLKCYWASVAAADSELTFQWNPSPNAAVRARDRGERPGDGWRDLLPEDGKLGQEIRKLKRNWPDTCEEQMKNTLEHRSCSKNLASQQIRTMVQTEPHPLST